MMKRIVITGGSGFIGTNLVQFYLDRNWDVLNLDCCAPRNRKHSDYFRETNILVYESLVDTIRSFNPDFLIHLAARTDLNETLNLSGYDANIEGVRNIIAACNDCKNIKRIIFASSMLVCKFGHAPNNEYDYSPNTLYGESKVLSEKIVREANISAEWLIVRPTSIWGPWFDTPYKNFFDVVLSGLFFHPGTRSGTSTYGFVGNTVYQINQLLLANGPSVQGHVFYLGDCPPSNLSDWANEIVEIAGKRKIKAIPYWFFFAAACVGDVLSSFKISFPLTGFRLRNITTNNILNVSSTQKLAPHPPFSRAEGTRETINWLRR